MRKATVLIGVLWAALALGQAGGQQHDVTNQPESAPHGDPTRQMPVEQQAHPPAGSAETPAHSASQGQPDGAGHSGGAHAPAAGGHAEDTPGYIIHHVSDSPEYEFEIPLSYNHVVIPLPVIHIPLQAGACPADPHEPASLMAGCLDLSITKHTVMMWLAALLLIGSLLTWGHRNKANLVPRGTAANLFEMLVVFVRDELAIKNIGKEEGERYTPFLATCFFFILFMNLLGLFPWMATATGNLAVTAALALLVFGVTQYAGIRAAGLGGYLAHLTGGVHWLLWPIMIPVEVLGLFTKPFALTIRLFANMLAGHIVIFFLLGLIFILGSPLVAIAAVPFAFGIYLLELFVAFVQAYVFTMLSALFIGMNVAMGHHAEHAHGEADAHGHAAGHEHGKAHPVAGH